MEGNGATFPFFLVLVLYHFFFTSLEVLIPLNLCGKTNKVECKKLRRIGRFAFKIWLIHVFWILKKMLLVDPTISSLLFILILVLYAFMYRTKS